MHSRSLRSLFGAGLVAGAFTALAPSDARADDGYVPKAPAIERSVLGNGLELLVVPDHRTPLVTVNIWYHVGSKDDPEGKSGFAHLFEHLMFQGSKHVPEDTFFQYLERAGATDRNGTTWDDRTNYFETVPSTELELVLWLESDRMGFLLDHVDQKTFESQRDVVKNEWRQSYANQPYGMVEEYVHDALFPKTHPYRRLTIGKPDELDRAALDDVKAFFRTFYVPNNATLVVAGDVDSGEAKRLVEKYFGAIPSGKLPERVKAAPVTLDHETRLTVEASVELPMVSVVWPTPRGFAAGDAELDLVAHALASGESSRLHKRLVRDLQVAKSVHVSQQSEELSSKFEIEVKGRPGQTAEGLLKVVDEELRGLEKEPFTQAEVDRAVTRQLSSMVFATERVGPMANAVNQYNQATGDPAFFPKDYARYAGATATKVSAAARTYLPLDRRVVALVVPTKGAPLAGKLVKTERKGGPR